MVTRVKTASEVAAMRESGRLLATVLQAVKAKVEPGVSTKDLARLAATELAKLGGRPAFLGYQGFPDVICISINDEVVHGIPRADKIIHTGDLVSLDFGVIYEDMITDAAITLIAGKPKQKRHVNLVSHTETALQVGIDAVHAGVRTGDIGASIERYLKKYGYGIVRDLVGHGVGHELHEDPNIPNYGRPDSGPWLNAGLTIAIEPMVTLGTDRIYIADDDWTVLTADGSWSAHFEHTVLITDTGAEILTCL